MRHEICPATMTNEQLADWIQTNKTEIKNHIEKFPLTPEEINEFQKSSSLASRAIDKLKDTLKYFQEYIKNGTPYDSATENFRPVTVTIPPSQGVKVLEANRKFADRQLESGYREEITPVYMLPWPEKKRMVALDIVGEEWSKYSRQMTDDEVRQHGRPILEATQEVRDVLAENNIEIEKIDGKQVRMRKKGKLDDMPALSDAEKDEIDGEGKEDPDRPY